MAAKQGRSAMSDRVNVEFEARLAEAGVDVSGAAAAGAVSEDFGRIARGRPLGLIRVRDERELQSVIELANSCRARLTLRSGGNSQSGQSLAHDSYCVSLSELERHVSVDASSATLECSASCSWRALIDAGAAHALVPKLVPLNLDLSIGGTLSAGGIGASSHRYGSACSNVLSLTAITGAGERVVCSRAERPEVFDAVLGGLGRSAAITSLTLSLRPARRNVHTVFALYTSLRDCLTDLRFLAKQAACSYIEGSCSTCFQGLRKTPTGRQPLLRWLYGIQFSVEHEGEPDAIVQPLIDQLRCLEVSHREDDEHRLFLDRYQARFESMRATGAWSQAHPWFECFLPADAAPAFIEELLPMIPVALGDGHRLFAIEGAGNPRYLQLPVDSSDTSLAFALLPAGVPDIARAAALGFIDRATDLLHRHGGKRYLSGWLGARDGAFWERHHGDLHREWDAVKRMLDPNGVLTSQLFPA
jgi:cytokinin dehydrogenase